MSVAALLLSAILQTATPGPASAPTTGAAHATAAHPASVLDPNKMICTREVRTGTLVGYEKICHTRAQWDNIHHLTRETWEALQGAKGTTNGR